MDPDANPSAAECPGTLDPCLVRDDGFNVRCEAGNVFSHDLTQTVYCVPGTDEELCHLGPTAEVIVDTCTNGCADVEVHFFDTVTEWEAFDSQTLCR